MAIGHAAADSAVGYLYQTWWALLELLRNRADAPPDAAISLELHDDVAWDVQGTPEELLSLKHHRTERQLTDSHEDVWRTIAVWRDSGSATDPEGPDLILVTTSTAATGSAASLLRRDSSRDEQAALGLLASAAATSTAQSTVKAREWFTGLSPADKQIFVRKITVLDGTTSIDGVPEAVETALWWALPTGHEETFLALIWSWWQGVALDMLQGRRKAVTRAEARGAINDVRDRFTTDNLPTLIELADVDEPSVIAAHEDSVFVTQMKWVKYARPNLQRAIVDYYRAVEHTTRWLDEDLIGFKELRNFEEDLKDEWGRAFDDMVDDLGQADEEAKAAAGKQLLRDLLESTAVKVRTRYDDRFFARGKRHELADGGYIGWHPDFRVRLETLLKASA